MAARDRMRYPWERALSWLSHHSRDETRMLHNLLLAVFTAGVATLTFALMGLASMASLGYRSSLLARSRRWNAATPAGDRRR